jgi:predicted enzyme related to lactoylglutathione lyase
MVEKQNYKHGSFSWVDAVTTDQSAGKQFYQELFGWDVEDVDVGDGAFYSMFSKNGKHVAALSQLSEDMKSQGVPPHWNSYITVDSADDIATKAKELGATVMMEPFDVFDAGRMTFIMDIQQAPFAIWQPKDHIGSVLVNEPNTFCWNELASKDVKQSIEFYTTLFGWTTEQMETANGPYQVIKNGEDFNGGMMQITEAWGDVPPHWSVYFAVEDCDASCEKIKSLGGKVVHGPFDAENVGRIAVVADPQGAGFMIMKLANPT